MKGQRAAQKLITAVSEKKGDDLYLSVALETSFGTVDCRYYPFAGSSCAAIWVGGVGGGWDTPAHGLYPRLCEELVEKEIASVRVKCRNPIDLPEAVLDVRTALEFLKGRNYTYMALVGHSFGGAAVIQAASREREVRTVVTLATQSYGADSVALLGPNCSLLAIHGMQDTVLPYHASQHVYRMARDPRRIILYPDAGHVLDEVADEVHVQIRDWIIHELGGAGGC